MMIKTLCLLSLSLILFAVGQGRQDLCAELPPMAKCNAGTISSLSNNQTDHTLILFPDLSFNSCERTITAVVELSMLGRYNVNGTKTIKLLFWQRGNRSRSSSLAGLYNRIKPEIELPLTSLGQTSSCDMKLVRMNALSNEQRQPPQLFNCTVPIKMPPLHLRDDDHIILGVLTSNTEHGENEIDPCLTMSKGESVCKCDLVDSTSTTIRLPPPQTENYSDSNCSCSRNEGNTPAPQIRIRLDRSLPTGSTPESTPDAILYLVPVVAVLLITIIVLIIAGFILFYRRKKRSLTLTASNGTYPNPVYHVNNHLQGGEQSASPTNADYDEISDESPTKKVPKESEIALEKCTQGNNYFTLTPTQEEEEKDGGKDGQAQTVAANYEVFISTQDHSGESFDEKPSAMFDMDDTYWEPADSINELYKQLSSDKYRDISPQQVDLSEVLGSGEFGTVNKGTWQSPVGAMEVAVKQLQPGASEEEKVKFLQEAAINGQFRHPNVVKLMGVVTTGETTMIVLELLSHGDLRSFLLKLRQSSVEVPKVSADQQCLLKFCQQIASGMEYLSNKAFVHRDLAARNILVSGDQACKISDFGMSRNLMDEDYYVSHGGRIPVKWTAPEAINYKKYSSASDVWSFGCVMYEIWSLGHKPFESHSNPEVIKMVDKGCRLPPPPGLSKELYKIMMQCWQPKTSHRPTFTQLVEMLSRADFELFVWKEEDLKDTHPQVKDIGAPLEVAENIYLDIQNMYK